MRDGDGDDEPADVAETIAGELEPAAEGADDGGVEALAPPGGVETTGEPEPVGGDAGALEPAGVAEHAAAATTTVSSPPISRAIGLGPVKSDWSRRAG